MAHEEKENGRVAATSGKGRLKAVDANSGNWEGNSRVEKPKEGAARNETGGGTQEKEGTGCKAQAPLAAQKRSLKTQLKEYDMKFMRENGRMPVKAEKEPIRHLYEEYNRVKDMIAREGTKKGEEEEAGPESNGGEGSGQGGGGGGGARPRGGT